MRLVKVMILMSSLLISLPVFAGSGDIKPILKTVFHGVDMPPVRSLQLPFEKAVRLNGLSYIVPSPRIRTEALNQGVNSTVGTNATWKSRLKCKAYKLCSPHLNSKQLEALVDRRILQEPFPGYYNSFSASWEHFAHSSGKLGTLEVILEAAYGPEEKFEGAFLSTYGEVVALFQTSFQTAATCKQALENAYNQGVEKESGFFVIQVQATEEHPQDVLLLELHNPQQIQFISLRQSLGTEKEPAAAQPQASQETNSRQATTQDQTAKNPEEDRTDTYFAMRRMGTIPNGLPATYEDANGVETDNFPVWTKEEFITHGTRWRQEHPFEADLAPYLERYFGYHLPRLYNFLSPIEKESILFNTPGLAEALAPCTTQQYDEAVAKWIKVNGREPSSYISKRSQQEYFPQLLMMQFTGNYHLIFHDMEDVPFKSLSYERQLEVLMWAWHTHHIAPPEVLAVLGN